MTEQDAGPRHVTLRINEDDLTALIDQAIAWLDASNPDPELAPMIDRVLEAARLEAVEEAAGPGATETPRQRCGYRRCPKAGAVAILSEEDYGHLG